MTDPELRPAFVDAFDRAAVIRCPCRVLLADIIRYGTRLAVVDYGSTAYPRAPAVPAKRRSSFAWS